METRLIAGAAIPSFDDQIPKDFEEDEWGPSGLPIVVAVKNDAGQVYRLFEGYGLRELVNICEALKRLGLTDELDGLPAQADAYDAVFRRQAD